MTIARVVVDVPASQTNKVFDYFIPEHLLGTIEIGIRVIVPFGSRTIMGYVLEIVEDTEVERVKSIKALLDYTPILTEELIELGKWLADHTMSFYISAFQAMLPQALKADYHKQVHRITDVPLVPILESVFAGRDYIDEKDLSDQNIPLKYVKQGIADGDLEMVYQVKSKETYKKVTMLKRKVAVERLDAYLANLSSRAKKQRELINYFIRHDQPVMLKVFLEKMKTTRQTLKPLLSAGIVELYQEELYRNPYRDDLIKPTSPLPLKPQQQHALTPIVNKLDQMQHQVFLLHGVTGSGKTEVYLQAIAHALSLGKEAIVLVPEIALTPQMVNRFKGRFGADVAVMHSALSKGERFDEWRKIQRKEVKVVVGARSAIFVPFENIGLIIIDEEHESSYKQEDHPRYHVKDVAIARGEYHRCPVILGTATPTLETFARANKGVYHLLSMPARMNEGQMPNVSVVDMRQELHAGNRTMFSRQLKTAIEERIARNEQIVLFLNRRGHSTFVMCRDCGHVVQCPHCDISLTYHRKQNLLKCHYCNYQEKMPQKCPSCDSQTIRYFGTGTQKVEEMIHQLIPEARVIRMDVDTTRKKGAHERLLGQFGGKQADILLGTQMIAKGLDFPDVTLVGVLAADSLLNLPDFRSAEKSFQLLTQVSGRAGRHHLEGEVIVQTYTPEHYSITFAKDYDYHGFFEKEMALRKAFQYPPYYFLTLITVSHENPNQALEVTRTISQLLAKHLSNQARILGPTPSPLERIKNRYRFQCMVKYKYEPKQKQVLAKILTYYEEQMRKEDLLIQIDLQPYQLM
ncbi:primosomal protein N' [Amphibacillus jilinensis]|uniref:primosomal protein N' n=1 Tax=Amphibacillus jilinensis TaxID=1216008 RepID=UPI000318C3E9|nr:primosomal protein N' [Amphibacillus jilinensis]